MLSLFHIISNIPSILFVIVQWNLFEDRCRLIDRNQFAKKQLLAFCRFREGTFGNWSSETAEKYCVCIYWKDIKHARLNNISIWIAKKSFCREIESGLSRSGADSDKATSIGKAEEDGVQCNRRYPLKLKLRNCIPWNWNWGTVSFEIETHILFADGLGLEVNLLVLILFPSSLIEIQIFSVKEWFMIPLSEKWRSHVSNKLYYQSRGLSVWTSLWKLHSFQHAKQRSSQNYF